MIKYVIVIENNNDIKKIKNIIGNYNLLKEYSNEDFLNAIYRLYYKIFNKYKNIELKNKMQNIFKIEIDLEKIGKQFLKFEIKIDKLKKFINKMKGYDIRNNKNIKKYLKLVFELKIKLRMLNKSYTHFFAKIIDFFMIRRFLDKDYINNGIYYCGAYHVINIIYILCKYFNFKITHTSNENVSKDKILELIKNNKLKNILNYYNFFFDDNINTEDLFYQCSDIRKMPVNLN